MHLTDDVNADAYSVRSFGAATFAGFDPTLPAHIAAAAAFHDRLIEIGFGPDRAAALFGLAEIADVRPQRTAYYDAFVLPPTAAGRAARFFVLHETEDEPTLRAWLGDALLHFLAEMTAIVPAPGGWRSLVSVTWFAGRLILTDARTINAIWPGDDPFPDLVMPPGGDSIGLLHVAPRTHRRASLDLCCGAGAQTLAAAAYSDRVVGVDINPRALRFARFNALANRIENATFVKGDAYEPLGDARFDAILANPPFVPWPDDGAALLFRGGGARGDDVIARILAGAVERLIAPGALTIVADLADTETLPARIAGWQGAELRTLLLLQHRYDLVAYAETHSAHRDVVAEREAQMIRLLRHFDASDIRTLDVGYIVQDGERGSTMTARTGAAQTTSIDADVAAWFAHQQRLARGDIGGMRLAFAPELRLARDTVRTADGRRSLSAFALPGPGSLHEAVTLTDVEFDVLDRVASRELRVADVKGASGSAALAGLLARGIVRLA